MKYRKVYVIYAVLAVLGVFALKSLVLDPAARLFELRSMRKEVSRLEMAAGKSSGHVVMSRSDMNSGIRRLLLSSLSCVMDAGCSVLSGTPARRKSPDTCPIYDLDIVFGGGFGQMVTAMSSIDSLVQTSSFEAGVSSCRIAVERSQDGREWNLVCRERIQCIPAVIPSRQKVETEGSEFVFENAPFFIPARKSKKRAAGGGSNIRGREKPFRSKPKARLVGRIGSGPDAVIVIESAGQLIQIRRGDDALLKDYGDSVRLVLNGIDTITVLQK